MVKGMSLCQLLRCMTDHRRLELKHPCAKGRNLVTCSDFSEGHLRHLLELPQFPGNWATPYTCPKCDYKWYDQRKHRLCLVEQYGWRVGAGASREDPGLDITCCVAM